jgi:flagellar biosynthesis protein FliR
MLVPGTASPVLEADGTLASLHSLLALAVFFSADLHHRAVEMFVESMARLPPGTLDWDTAPRLLLHVVTTAGPAIAMAMATLSSATARSNSSST